jgi:hypothetical protein
MTDMKYNLKYGDIPLIEVNHGLGEYMCAVFLTDNSKYAVYETDEFGGGYRHVENFDALEEATKKAEEGYP